MALLCNISSEVPEHPVLNTKSNLVYERRLIEKHLYQFGNDPITNEASTVDDLIDIKVGRVIKPASKNASVPSMLMAVQDEWDALALQNFTLKQQLHVTRQELSHALYQHDAACRVIARLQKELAMAKQALTAIKSHTDVQVSYSGEATATNSAHDQVDRQNATAAGTGSENEALTDNDKHKIDDANVALSEARKNRSKELPTGPTADEIVAFSEHKKFPLHSVSHSGITCLDLHYGSERIATGGIDKEVIIFDKKNEHIVATLNGHAGRISRVRWHPRTDADIVVSASYDASVRIWSVNERSFLHQLLNHTGPITGLSVHPIGDYILSGGEDCAWTLSSTHTGQMLLRTVDADQQPVQDCAFHSDGKLLACAVRSGITRIYDAVANTCVADLKAPDASPRAGDVTPVTALCFSDNGYHYYVAHEGVGVACWDLRKLKTARSIELPADSVVNDIHVDYAAKYLGLAGTSQATGLYQCKGMQALLPLDSHGASAVTGIRFAQDSRYVVTTSLDRYLRLFY